VLQELLAGGHVDAAVFALRPDYRAMPLAVDGLVPGPSDQTSKALLQAAEATAGEALRDQPVEQLPHVAAWREAYRAFGAKPHGKVIPLILGALGLVVAVVVAVVIVAMQRGRARRRAA
jgi:hypothetical protein